MDELGLKPGQKRQAHRQGRQGASSSRRGRRRSRWSGLLRRWSASGRRTCQRRSSGVQFPKNISMTNTPGARSQKTICEAGDLVWVVFDPVIGSEQGGRRPAIVLTARDYHQRDARSVVCPITRNLEPWPTKIILPPGMKTKGAILGDQLRSVHRAGRSFRFIEKAPPEVLRQLREVVSARFSA